MIAPSNKYPRADGFSNSLCLLGVATGLVQAARVEQQGPPRLRLGLRGPRRPCRPRQEGLLPRLSIPVSRVHRGLPAGPRGGASEREREAAGRGAPQGAGRLCRGVAAGRGRLAEVSGNV